MVYLLVIFGAVIMLMPFGWMVSTSFKLPSEVNKWPPQWGSKNFLSKREIKVKVGIETIGVSWEGIGIREALSRVEISKPTENTLKVLVNDDPFYRGELHILITSDGRYARRVPIDEVKSLISRFSNLDFLRGKDFKDADEFFEYVFEEMARRLDRIEFTSRVEKFAEGALRVLRTLERFSQKRVKDEKDREKLLDFLSHSAKVLDRTVSSVTTHKRGTTKVLEISEIEKISSLMKETLSNIKPPRFEDTGAKALMRLYSKKVYEPFEKIVEELEFYTEVERVFKNVQREALDTKEIVARFRKKKDRIALLLKRLRSNLPGRYEEISHLIESGVENLPERYLSYLDDEMAEDLKNLGIDEKKVMITVSEMRQITSTLLTVASERGIDILKLARNSKNIEELLKKLEKPLGDSASYKVLKGKIRKLSRSLGGENTLKFLERSAVELIAVAKLRRIYNDTLSELQLISHPSIVKAVRVKEGKLIEIVLDGISPVYLEDENYRVAVFFTPAEVLANIFQNYVDAWHAAPFGRYYMNTVFVATATTVLEVILASMAAFAFSIMKFPGRDFLFGLFLMTMMVPGEVLLVPNFITVSKFGWIDTYYALIIPWIVSVFAIFLIRQHFLTLPTELYDAAKIDGCSNWRYLWTVAVPLSKPVIITGALLKFVGSWNAFLWVLIVTNSEKYRTLPVGLHTFSSEAGTVYNQLMAAATFSILPVIILFLFMQKYFIRGIARTGLK